MSDAVLFLHASGVGPVMWQRYASSVPSGLAIRRPPNLGYPPGPRAERGRRYTLEEDLTNALDAVRGDDGVHLVGHSYGGLLALELALRLGDRLRSLWVYEPALIGALEDEPDLPAEARGEIDRIARHPWFVHDDARAGTDEWIGVFLSVFGEFGFDELPGPMQATLRELAPKMVSEVRAGATAWRPLAEYRTRVPTTFAVGTKSLLVAAALAEELGRANAHAVVDRVEGATHLAPVYTPALVLPSFERHLARATSSNRR